MKVLVDTFIMIVGMVLWVYAVRVRQVLYFSYVSSSVCQLYLNKADILSEYI